MLASGSEAIAIDASLDPSIYVDMITARGWTLRHVIDTHVHADHVSRSRALAEQAGATLWLPDQRRTQFPYQPLRDGSRLLFGTSILSAMSTPGHTLESTCYLVDDLWLLTGDTLFLSGVGRPDLEASADEARIRAGLLHASLERLMALSPNVLVLPAHTSSPVAFDDKLITATLGAVRDAVRLPADRAEFVEYVLGRIPPTPPNHRVIVGLNESGELPAGDPTDLEAGANRCAVS